MKAALMAVQKVANLVVQWVVTTVVTSAALKAANLVALWAGGKVGMTAVQMAEVMAECLVGKSAVPLAVRKVGSWAARRAASLVAGTAEKSVDTSEKTLAA